jgi:hypothetical protein
MTSLASLSLQLTGHVPANRDAVVRVRNELTGAVHESKPFLDGTLQLRNLAPGPYELEVVHPNLMTAIDRRKIRIFDQITPTLVRIPVPADLFRDRPIRDVPDADLTPVQQLAERARGAMAPIASKAAGEVIRAQDWNAMAGAVSDLAGAVLELTRLVSPQGHDHPEIADKIGEVQDNLRRFSESFGRTLVELKREIEVDGIRRRVTDMLDLAAAPADLRAQVETRVKDVEDAMQSDTSVFTRKLAGLGSFALSTVNDLAEKSGPDADKFVSNTSVAALAASARSYVDAGTQVKAESELQTYKRSAAASGGRSLFIKGV